MSSSTVNQHITSNKHVQADPDVLAVIWGLNTDLFLDDDALRSLQIYAQVCRAWRYTLLNAQHLWGRLVDLDAFNRQATDEWAREVVRRAGPSSSFWIKGAVIRRAPVEWIKGADGISRVRKRRDSIVPKFFFWLLNIHWVRFERLVITVETPGPFMDPQLWGTICLPAPRIREFSLWRDETITTYSSPLDSFDTGKMNLDIQSASWLNQIRSLSIGPFISLSDTLAILKQAPCLETLHVRLAIEPNETIPTITSGLLNHDALKQVKLTSSMYLCTCFLGSVLLPRSCSLDLSITGPHMDIPPDAVSRLLSNFSKTYFTAQYETRIEVEWYIAMTESRTKIVVHIDDTPFSITMKEVDSHTYRLSETLPIFGVVSHFSLEITVPLFDSAWFDFSPLVTTQHTFEYNNTIASTALRSLLRSSPSTPILIATCEGLRELLAIQGFVGHGHVLLPVLEILQLKGYINFRDISSFLGMRRDIGHSIPVLDITAMEIKREDGPTSSPSRIPKQLDEFVGLKVLWRQVGVEEIQEYICGSKSRPQ